MAQSPTQWERWCRALWAWVLCVCDGLVLPMAVVEYGQADRPSRHRASLSKDDSALRSPIIPGQQNAARYSVDAHEITAVSRLVADTLDRRQNFSDCRSRLATVSSAKNQVRLLRNAGYPTPLLLRRKAVKPHSAACQPTDRRDSAGPKLQSSRGKGRRCERCLVVAKAARQQR